MFCVNITDCIWSKEHHPNSEAWWQYHTFGLLFFSCIWGLRQSGGQYEQFQILSLLCERKKIQIKIIIIIICKSLPEIYLVIRHFKWWQVSAGFQLKYVWKWLFNSEKKDISVVYFYNPLNFFSIQSRCTGHAK